MRHNVVGLAVQDISLSFSQPIGFLLLGLLFLGLLAKIKVLGVLPAHLPLVLDAGILVSVYR